MTISSGRKHAGPGPGSDQPPVPEPTFAERARTLVYLGRVGSLSTLSRKQPGFPFGSVMPYGLDDRGRPIFLISTMAMHTQNLQADIRASLLVTQQDTEGEPLGASRVTLVGNVQPAQNTELAEVRKLYLEHHANSKYWVDFENFFFYRMDVPEYNNDRTYVSYTEPIAFALAGNYPNEFICTFSPESGLKIYHSDDFSQVVGHAVSPFLMNWRDTHFRPDPAHMAFVSA